MGSFLFCYAYWASFDGNEECRNYYNLKLEKFENQLSSGLAKYSFSLANFDICYACSLQHVNNNRSKDLNN
ncbi:hypothetical protein T08_5383 [Trichinella sp. T8]|nr:hypothetical protein T08_5383 [Trichinella sp. T8]